MQLPLTVEDISAEWLTTALSQRQAGVRIESFKIEQIIWGTATKVLIGLRYAEPGAPSLPQSVCVKGGFDPKLRDLALATAYQREANFFSHLAPTLDIPQPQCLFSGVDVEQRQGVIILDNLVHRGCTFGEPTHAWSVGRVRSAVEVLASLHGATWGANRDRYQWLDSVPPVRQVAEIMLGAAYWDTHFAQMSSPYVPAKFLDRERMFRAFQQSWRYENAADHCVLHGDPHLGNTYVTSGGQPAFVDWQAVCAGPAIDDVAYFIGGALEIEDRRVNERELLMHYLETLVARGGPAIPFDAAWLDYRRFQVHGFLWATTGSMQQTSERVAAMTARHVAAMEDLECYEALGV